MLFLSVSSLMAALMNFLSLMSRPNRYTSSKMGKTAGSRSVLHFRVWFDGDAPSE